MTDKQRLEVRCSEIRQRLNELSGLSEPTEEQTAEMDRLAGEFRTVETRLRAVTIAASEPEGAEGEPDTTGEGAELRALAERAEVRRFLSAAVSGVALTGAESELAAAAKVEARAGGVVIPWEALEPARLEVRADAVTDTGALDGGTAQRPILARLFGRSIMEALGVRIDSVPAGQAEYVLFATGVSPTQTAEKAAKDAEAATFTTNTLKPKRLTGRYRWTVEQSAHVGAGLEAAFRRDLRDAVMAAMSNGVINGNGTAPNVTGFLNRLTAPAVPGTVATYSDYAGAAASAVDGIHATTEGEVSIVAGTATYRHAAGVIASGSSEAATEAMARRSGGFRASSFIPAAPDSGNRANVQAALLHAGQGSARGDSVAAMWPGVEVIRDPYTAAASGEVSLTWVALWDAYTVFRSDAYKRVAFKLA